MIEKDPDSTGYEFIEGPPSDLNRKLREGMIDVSPSSSIEYLRYPDRYTIIEGHSISSAGPVGSILLFSKRPLETLSGLEVLTSSQSETSVALLKIILTKFYDIECSFRSTHQPIADALQSGSALMLIGDDALREALKWPALFIYDLGDLWQKHTGLPFTFALWMSRNDLSHEKDALLRRFIRGLDRAKEAALRNLQAIARAAGANSFLSEAELITYWQGISYDFGPHHKKGLELFRKYSTELGLA